MAVTGSKKCLLGVTSDTGVKHLTWECFDDSDLVKPSFFRGCGRAPVSPHRSPRPILARSRLRVPGAPRSQPRRWPVIQWPARPPKNGSSNGSKSSIRSSALPLLNARNGINLRR